MADMNNSAETDERSYVALRALSKRYGVTETVKSLDLSIRRGEMIALLGPSGCGKTSTLRMMAGLTSVSSGNIILAGEDITDTPVHMRNIGLVFQSYALFPHMSVADNIGFGLKMRGVATSQAAQATAKAVAQVRLTGLENRKPKELSGGQQQRVALARALVTNPRLLLLDEPLSNLDAKLRDDLRAELRETQQRHRMTTLFVTHDQAEALSTCDRIAVMNGGRIEQVGTPQDIYERPATPFVASFVGRTNRFDAEALQKGAVNIGGTNILTGGDHRGRATVMIRPHRIAIAPAGTHQGPQENRFSGEIRKVTYIGDLIQYDIVSNGLLFTAETTTSRPVEALSEKDSVDIAWAAKDTLVFEEAA